MIAKAIEKILELAEPVTTEVSGITYSTKVLHKVNEDLRADPISVSTLSSIVRYVKEFASIDDNSETPMIAHVVSPDRVELISALDSDRKREKLMVADAETPDIPFGTYIENEKMCITIQSMFVDDEDTDKKLVLRFAGTVTAGSVNEYGDDGVTQKATVKHGVASKAEAIVPSPCMLRPFRTFIEVQQPASKFIFRLKEGQGNTVYSALFEADGGAWKVTAMRSIRNYLEAELEGTGVVVIS